MRNVCGYASWFLSVCQTRRAAAHAPMPCVCFCCCWRHWQCSLARWWSEVSKQSEIRVGEGKQGAGGAAGWQADCRSWQPVAWTLCRLRAAGPSGIHPQARDCLAAKTIRRQQEIWTDLVKGGGGAGMQVAPCAWGGGCGVQRQRSLVILLAGGHGHEICDKGRVRMRRPQQQTTTSSKAPSGIRVERPPGALRAVPRIKSARMSSGTSAYPSACSCRRTSASENHTAPASEVAMARFWKFWLDSSSSVHTNLTPHCSAGTAAGGSALCAAEQRERRASNMGRILRLWEADDAEGGRRRTSAPH